jgi:hypothetical protein
MPDPGVRPQLDNMILIGVVWLMFGLTVCLVAVKIVVTIDTSCHSCSIGCRQLLRGAAVDVLHGVPVLLDDTATWLRTAT